MRGWAWGVLAAALGAGQAQAAAVAVTITGLAETAYELDVSGIHRSGRLAASPGTSTVRDVVEVGALTSVTAAVRFLGRSGVLASCPEVRVRLEGAGPTCDPAFVLSGRRTGTDSFLCESRCAARRPAEREESDEDEWVYAARGRSEPLVEGWPPSQSFYTGAIYNAGAPRLYSPGQR